eukprot:TRINITY_DN3480_c0_g2_i1.p1 TRINITY_DN3480_c0_g2~~TRINITY_DN3480_c0_g2_i1.p1  ORF type:complete len:183 (-),score=65.77 TRINITY_DN3480_c0_g2_i1:499-1047(-)
MKPDWDKLADKVHASAQANAVIVDVDCTDKASEKLCSRYGVQGYPTIKWFKDGKTAPDGDAYEEGRDFKSMKKFVKRAAKKPCQPDTEENCDKKDKKYIEEIKDMTADKMKEEFAKMSKEIDDLAAQHKEEADLFERQKDEAIATQKRSTELKESLKKLRDKTAYKVHILKEKTGAGAKQEL